MSDRPTFYVDRCLGKAVARALRAAGASVQVHDDLFEQDALDDDWIPIVSHQGWVILTKDKNIRWASGERFTVLTSNARIITLSSGNMNGPRMSELFVANLSAMESLAASHRPPFVAVLGLDGLQVVLPRPTPPAEEPGESADDGDS